MSTKKKKFRIQRYIINQCNKKGTKKSEKAQNHFYLKSARINNFHSILSFLQNIKQYFQLQDKKFILQMIEFKTNKQSLQFVVKKLNYSNKIILQSFKESSSDQLFKEQLNKNNLQKINNYLRQNTRKSQFSIIKISSNFNMKSQYFSVYNNFDLIQQILYQRLSSMFPIELLTSHLTYQQILVYLDQQCSKFSKQGLNSQNLTNLMGQQNQDHFSNTEQLSKRQRQSLKKNEYRKLFYRAERNISKQVFDSCNQTRGKTTLKDFIWKYIEILETSKLCLIRQQAKQQVLEHRLESARKKVRESTYIYIKLIQATVHSRYSDTPCFQYKIVPSSIPTVTVVNSLNPILNHQYTLEMDQQYFYIYFYDSGVELYKWKFDLQDFSDQDTEFSKSIATQAVTFEIQVKMLPKGTSQQVTQLTRQIQSSQQKLKIARKAFQNLCFYMPFQQYKELQQNHHIQQSHKNVFWQFTTSLFSFLPFLRHHVLALHYVLIALIFVECLASISWAVQFIDLIIAFGLLGALYDRSKPNINMLLWAGLFGMFLSTIKTIWGALLMPFGMPKYPFILLIAIIFKTLTMFFIWISTVRSEQISVQRMKDLYGQKNEQQVLNEREQHPIFKANENYYKNKQNAQIIY